MKSEADRLSHVSWIVECGEFARATLASPPKHPHVLRVEPRGDLVASFVLPLELVKPQNRTQMSRPWMRERTKKTTSAVMRSQFRELRFAPLPGRPMVRCIRFSSVEPDRYNDGFKVAVDRLVDMLLIQDDKPAKCDLHQLWEYAPPKRGFGLIEVFTGAAQ